jgi:ribosomally synthesized peptide (two-chain TOMM family)
MMAKPKKTADKSTPKGGTSNGNSGNNGRPSALGLNAGLDPLIAFRLAYLRAIAGYWRDAKQFDKTLKAVEAPGTRRPFSHDKVMSTYCPGFKWPWDDLDLQLKILDESQIEFGLNGNSGWTGPPNNVTIYLPGPPQNPDDYAEALAAYYAQFPSFFGSGITELRPAPPPSDGSGAPQDVPGPGPGGAIGTLPTGLGDLQSFFEFGAVIVRLLALLWHEQAQTGSAKVAKAPKPTNPTKPKPTAKEQFPIRTGVFGTPPTSSSAQRAPQTPANVSDGNAALVKFLGYAVPWNMTFSFVEAKAAVYEPRAPAGRWLNLPANCLEMHLPNKPKDLDAFALPVALTSYNSTGALYPLTCGC